MSFTWSPFVFLLFTNSEKDGICGNFAFTELSIGTHGEVSDLALPEGSLPVSSFEGSKARGCVRGCSASVIDVEELIADVEELIALSRSIRLVGLVVVSHLTVLATCE